jgi:hypothetical protein
MRKLLIALPLVLVASAATAQTSTTNCNSYIPNNVQCTTTTTPSSGGVNWGAFMQQQQQIQQQQNQQMQQSMQNLGTAIAAQRERKRQEKAAAAQQAELDALKTAVANDPDVPQPPPIDEQPVRLVCTANGHTAALALYEKHGRVDVSADGDSHTRRATFNTDMINWNTPIARASLNRLDGSYSSIATFRGVEGQVVTSGSCSRVIEPKF